MLLCLPTEVVQEHVLKYLAPVEQRNVRLSCKKCSELKYFGITALLVKYIDRYAKYTGMGEKIVKLMLQHPGRVQVYGSILAKVLHADSDMEINDLDIAVVYDYPESIHFAYKRFALGKIDQIELDRLQTLETRELNLKDIIRADEVAKKIYAILSSVKHFTQIEGIHPSYHLYDTYFTHFSERGNEETVKPVLVSIQYTLESIGQIIQYADELSCTANYFDGTLHTKNTNHVCNKIGYFQLGTYAPNNNITRNGYYEFRRIVERLDKYTKKGYTIFLNTNYVEKYLNLNNWCDLHISVNIVHDIIFAGSTYYGCKKNSMDEADHEESQWW